ncbi:fatty acid desaturase [Pseudomonas aeruginosa]|nr:fatty acid desaturase [Pseudomonas aeruginosa]
MRDDRELTPEQLAAFGAELDALHLRTLADLGADDARYIRRVRAAVRVCCWSGRALLMFGWLPPTWLLGSLLLGLGKILENMELGHNVMHGQYDWMNDPEFAGRAYEWDIAGPSDFWRHTHNHIHHTYTNVLGKDDDVGYGGRAPVPGAALEAVLPLATAVGDAAGAAVPVRGGDPASAPGQVRQGAPGQGRTHAAATPPACQAGSPVDQGLPAVPASRPVRRRLRRGVRR